MEPIKPIAATSHLPPVAHYTEMTTFEGCFVMALIERWGMVAGKRSGEDTAGRAGYDLQTPEELVARAVETTKATMSALLREGWLVENPVLARMLEDDRKRVADEALREAKRTQRAAESTTDSETPKRSL